MTIDFPTAFSSWGSAESLAAERVRESGYFTMGEEVKVFEREFADFHKMKHGIMVNSGSSANLIAVASLFHKEDNPLHPGDLALVPALAWSTTYAPLVQYGLNLALLDVDSTWNARPVSTLGFARLVVGCSILGNPAHLQHWRMQSDKVGAYFIEDNCESLGALSRDEPGPYNRLTGTFGDLNTFSFFYSHQLSAIEGGMVLTNDDELADLCRMLRAHGWTRDVVPAERFDGEYDFRLMGYNVRPLDLHAAVAREQLKKLEHFRRQRHQNLNNFQTWCSDLPVLFPTLNGIQSPFAINFLVKDRETRLKLAHALRAKGIDCRLPTGGSFRRHRYGQPWANQETPGADHIHDCGLFIGNPPWPCEEPLLRAVKAMEETLR